MHHGHCDPTQSRRRHQGRGRSHPQPSPSSSELGTGATDVVNVTNSSGGALTRYIRVRYYSGGTGATNGKYTLNLNW